jgi:tetratricopeptide (TPR) repeat protein
LKHRRSQQRPLGARSIWQHPQNLSLWTVAALLLVIGLTYGQVWHYDFVNYDDPTYVTDNPYVRSGVTVKNLQWAFTTGQDGNWFPLTWVSHILVCQLFGVQAGAHHIANVLLHAPSTLLLFALLRRWTKAYWRSAFVALVFAIHPLHVESVAWIAERKDELSGFFWFLTLWAYTSYTQRRSFARYLIVILLFGCGLMSKSMVVTLPFVMLLLDVWPLGRLDLRAPSALRTLVTLVIEKIPLFALSLVVSLVTYRLQKQGGAVVSSAVIPIAARIQNAVVTYLIYLGKFLWPGNLAVIYPDLPVRPLWQVLTSSAALVGISAAVIRARVHRPYLAVGWFWYVGTLVPVIGLIQVGVQSRADRYMYLPLVGLAIILAWGTADLFQYHGWKRSYLAALAIAGSGGWFVVTAMMIPHWHDSVSLFTHAIAAAEGNWVAYNNRGGALLHEGHAAEAVADFASAAELRPDQAQIQNSLGEALLALGQIDQAIPRFQEASRLEVRFAKARVNLGSAFMKKGMHAEAEESFRMAIDIQPDNAEARYGLGASLRQLGHAQEALPYLVSAIPLLTRKVAERPDDLDSRFNLAVVLDVAGRTQEAVDELSAILREQPSDAGAHFQLGITLAHGSRFDEAIAEFSEALRLDPNLVDARRGIEEAATLKKQLSNGDRKQ